MGNSPAGWGGQAVTNPDLTPPGPPEMPRPLLGIHYQTHRPATSQSLATLAVVLLRPSPQRSSKTSEIRLGLQEDGGNLQMGSAKMGEPVPQTTGKVIIRVPPGYVLGPLLLIIYKNYLDSAISSNISKFAVHTKIGKQISSEQEAMVLHEELNRMHDWAVKL